MKKPIVLVIMDGVGRGDTYHFTNEWAGKPVK